jgi:hypothetical protein
MGTETKLVRALDIPKGLTWINTLEPLTQDHLQGKVVLFVFWDYCSASCLRTLPYLRTWYDRYADLGFESVGVHTPRFEFGKRPASVRAAVGRLGIRWPVVLDNDKEIWTRSAVQVSPTLHMRDGAGHLRFQHQGEGAYAETESAIQNLLRDFHPRRDFPPPVEPVRPEDAPGVACYPISPGPLIGNVGNGPLLEETPRLYSIPSEVRDGCFYLEGSWKKAQESLVALDPGASILLPYRAASVDAVLGFDRGLAGISHRHSACEVVLKLNGLPLAVDNYAEDVYMDRGESRIRVELPRNYFLVRHTDIANRSLRLRTESAGLQFFAFSFGSGVIPHAASTTHKEA